MHTAITRHPRAESSPRRETAVIAAVMLGIVVAAAVAIGPVSAAEPGLFSPAPDAVSIEPAPESLGLRPILTQSFLQVTDGPLEL